MLVQKCTDILQDERTLLPPPPPLLLVLEHHPCLVRPPHLLYDLGGHDPPDPVQLQEYLLLLRQPVLLLDLAALGLNHLNMRR